MKRHLRKTRKTKALMALLRARLASLRDRSMISYERPRWRRLKAMITLETRARLSSSQGDLNLKLLCQILACSTKMRTSLCVWPILSRERTTLLNSYLKTSKRLLKRRWISSWWATNCQQLFLQTMLLRNRTMLNHLIVTLRVRSVKFTAKEACPFSWSNWKTKLLSRPMQFLQKKSLKRWMLR